MSITSVRNDTLGKDSFVNSQKPVPPTISGYTISGVDDTALDPAGGQTILINGTGFQRGATVVVDGTTVSVVSFINSNQLSFTSIAKSAGSYAIYVVNADLGTAIYIPGLIYSTLPTWTTGAGSLGSYYETTAISNTVVAGGDAPLTYALASGTLPSGATLSSGGVISGTSPADTGSTTYSFTVEAIDAQLQSSTRSFSLTINTDVVTWSNPANNATIALDGVAYSNALSATSAAGYGVVYSADTLPPGLTLTGGTISGTPTTQDTTVSVLTATANTTGRSATNTITWVVSLGDIYFNLTTMLLSGSANTFVNDASTNRFPITVVGDTKPSNFSPYLTGWSNQFDGTGDYLTAPANASLALGNSDYTVECWVNLQGTQTTTYGWGVFGTYPGSGSGGWSLTINRAQGNQGIVWILGSSIILDYTATFIPTNTWTHIAVSRSGSGTNNTKIFLNGVMVNQVTDNTNDTFSGLTYIGGQGTGQLFTGHISNVRVVKGTAVYTTNFTPPTQPLTAIAGTSLLTCADNRFVDDSANNFTITRNGDVAISGFSPFTESATTRGSGYFDGTGDYIETQNLVALAPATDFTAECWVYNLGFSGSQYGRGIFSLLDSSNADRIMVRLNSGANVVNFYGAVGGNPVFGTSGSDSSLLVTPMAWTHVALTRQGSAFKVYLNGILAVSATSSANFGNIRRVQVAAVPDGSVPVFNGYVSNFRYVNGTAVYTANFTPPTQPLTAVTNTSLLTLQTNNSHTNNQFVDSSGSNFLITRNGNTTQGSFSPYSPSGWSNYFDGSGDYLTVPNNTGFAFGSGVFTVEMWVYITGTSGTVANYSNGQSSNSNFAWELFQVNSSTLQFSVFQGATQYISSSASFSLNGWNHIACVRNGNTLTTYVNGVAGATTANLTGVTISDPASSTLKLCSYGNGSSYVTGYISNVRVVKGTAVYTANFTPSTQPLTAIAGTTLLTCCNNRFIDESPNNFVITRMGDTRITNFAPHKAVVQTPVSYSTYFDGSGDYLTLPSNQTQFSMSTGDFTIEMWVYIPSLATTRTLYDTMNSGDTTGTGRFAIQVATSGTLQVFTGAGAMLTTGGTVTAGAWAHIAYAKASNSGRLYVNGIQVNTTYNDNNTYTVGSTSRPIIGVNAYDNSTNPMLGYISNLRIIKGTAVYTTNFTPPTQALTAITNTSLLTCQSPTVIDNSTNRFAITAAGNAQPSTVNPFGSTFVNSSGYTVAEYSGSAYFDGSGDYLDLPNSTIFSQTGAWTLELWVYPTAAQNNYVYSQNTANFLQINISAAMFVLVDRSGVGTLITSSSTIPLNTWTHLALVSDGSNMRLFINGTQSGSTAGVGTQAASATTTRIGAYQGTGSLAYAGYVSDLRLVKGRALYTSNFATPTAPLLPVPNTTLLLNGTGAGITDATTKNILETVGDVRVSTAVAKFGGSSMRFDGAGDYLALPASANFTFGTGNFTVEAWVNYVAITNSGIFQIGSGIFPLTNGVGLGLDSSGRWMLYYANGSAAGTAFAPVANTWYHVAVVRNSGTTKVYLDGVSVMSVTDATNYTGTFLGIGGIYSTSYLMNGYLQDFRITKGSARYTTNFTPPTAALQNK